MVQCDMHFRFLALTNEHEVVRGTIHAHDRAEAQREIIRNGLNLQLIQEITDNRAIRVSRWKKFASARLSSKSKQQFFQELSILMRSGVTLEHALQIIANGRDKTSKEYTIFTNLLRNIRAGRSLSDAMNASYKNFSYAEVNIVRAAEQVGQLGEVMDQLAGFAKNIESVKKKIHLAMIYPSIVLLVMMFIFIIMNGLVFPQFEEIFFAQPVGTLPVLTCFVMFFCKNIGKWLCWMIFLILGGVFCSAIFLSDEKKQKLREICLSRIPWINKLVNDYSLYLFSSVLKMLLSCRVDLQQAIYFAKNVVLTKKLGDSVDRAIGDVRYGNTLAHALSGILSRIAVGLVSAGEQSGKLQESFEAITNIYYDALITRLAVLATMIEPILVIFVAIIVGVAVAAIFLPLINMMNGISM